jgi:hypothetical protein
MIGIVQAFQPKTAFSLSRAYRPFMRRILKGSSGSILLKKSLAAATRC